MAKLVRINPPSRITPCKTINFPIFPDGKLGSIGLVQITLDIEPDWTVGSINLYMDGTYLNSF
jgi:hypothetical protein